MIDLTRRGFLGGLLAAPAIVRFASIMPVSVLPPELLAFDPANLEPADGQLTIEQITREAVRLMKSTLDAKGVGYSVSSVFVPSRRWTTKHRQVCVDVQYSFGDRASTMREFSDRLITPAIAKMASRLRACDHRLLATSAIRVEQLELPHQVDEVASVTDGGLSMRGLSDYSVMHDRMLLRFDMFYSVERVGVDRDALLHLAGPVGRLP